MNSFKRVREFPDIHAKTRNRMTMAITFYRQNDAGSRGFTREQNSELRNSRTRSCSRSRIQSSLIYECLERFKICP